MKVLLISHIYMYAIFQTRLYELAKFPDVELRVIVPSRWDGSNRFSLRPEIPVNASFSYCPLPTVFAPDIRIYLYLSSDLTMRTFQPDIIHVEESPRCLSLFQALVYKQLWAPRAKSLLFSWNNVFVPYPSFVSFFERYNFSHTDWALAGGQDAADILKQRGFRKPISLIPQLGVDPELFRPGDGSGIRRQLGIAPTTFVIGFASRMVPEKGPRLLVEAVAHLQGDWALLLMGKGPEKEIALRRAEALGISDHLRVVDEWVPYLEFVHYLRAMDVYVLPSISIPTWSEQFGGGLLWAMACGVLAVGSSCGEIPNLIGNAGLVFPEGDVQALADCLCSLQTHPDLRAQLINRGFEQFRPYTWRARAEQTYQVYTALMNEHSSRA